MITLSQIYQMVLKNGDLYGEFLRPATWHASLLLI